MTQKRRKSRGHSLSGTNLKRAGDHNQRVTLQAIRINGPIARSELVAITGLTPPSIANITNRLLDEGLILEAGRLQGSRGLPAMTLAVNPDGCYAIGVNIDRDHITAALVDFSGRVREQVSRQIDFPLPADVKRFFKAALPKLLSSLDQDVGKLIGVGVALPDDLGNVALPHRPKTYSAWNTTDVRQLFSSLLPVPVYAENDAAAAALAELQFGEGMRKPSFFYILITWGLGGSLVIDGEGFRGADGRSGEIGFLPVRSSASAAKTLQQVASLSALYERLEERGFKVTDPDDLMRLPDPAQAIVSAWIDDAAEVLVDPMINISCLVNPQAVFIGGRLPAALVDALADALNERLRRIEGVPAVAVVARASTAASAPVIGAAILPFMDRLLPSRATLRKTAET